MGIFDGELIASDIDLTFLDHKTQPVARNFEALGYFRANGGKFCFATGRSHSSLAKLIPGVEQITNAPSILANGSYLCDLVTDTVYDETCMDPEISPAFFADMLARFPNNGFRIAVLDEFYIPRLTDRIWGETEIYAGHRHVMPISEMPQSGWHKLVWHGTPEELDEIRDTMMADPRHVHYEIVKSNSFLLEAIDVRTSKGVQLKNLQNRLGAAGVPVRTWAIGDYSNDLAMLRAADVAVCPSNAIEEVKNVCGVTVCSCDDGAVADLVEYIEREKTKRVSQ